jgi:hypothetical protein
MAESLLQNKKCISEIVGYVLLVVIAMGLSVLVYFYLEGLTPRDKLECPEGISLILRDNVCDAITQNLRLEFYNNGLFGIDGVYVKLGKEGKTIKTNLNDPEDETNNSFYIPLSPRKELAQNYNLAFFDNNKGVELFENYSVEIQPAVAKKNEKYLTVCEDSTISQKITCSSQKNLVGYWKFEGGYGDSSGNGLNGESVFIIPNETSGDNHYISFNGDGKYISIPKFVWNATKTPKISISFWVNVRDSDVSERSLFSAVGADAGQRIQAHVPWSNKVLYWDYGDENQQQDKSRVSLDYTPYLNKWTHVVLTSAGGEAGGMKIYIGGILRNQTSNSQSPTGMFSSFVIGKFDYYGNPKPYSGMVDEFMIFNKTLSSSEIKSIYNHQKKLFPSAP